MVWPDQVGGGGDQKSVYFLDADKVINSRYTKVVEITLANQVPDKLFRTTVLAFLTKYILVRVFITLLSFYMEVLKKELLHFNNNRS